MGAETQGWNCCGYSLIEMVDDGGCLLRGKAIVVYKDRGLVRARCTRCGKIRWMKPPFLEEKNSQ